MRIANQGLWLGFTLLAAVLSGCMDGPYVEGSGRLIEEERPVADFVKLEVEDGIEARVRVEPGQPAKLRVTGDDNLVELVRTEGFGGNRLRVSFREHAVGDWDSHNPLRVELTVPRLESVVRSGGGTMDVAGTVDAESFEVDVSGGSRLRVSGLDTARLEVEMSGGSQVILEGEATHVTSTHSGGSVLHGRELSAREAHLTSSGGSVVSMRVSDALEVTASGGGRVNIIGQPAVRSKELSGGATLTFE
ncbi:head GIN domain-containing protein [Pyxidicoccus sp. 3LFB2]